MTKTTNLHAAASFGSVECALSHLENGSTDDIDRLCGDDQWTPLMVAADEGFLRIVRLLLRFGADVKMMNDRGHTALHISVLNKHLAVTKALMKAGADLEARADFFTAMPDSIQGHTPLHLAAGVGFGEGISALIDAGARVDSRLTNGSTPLYLAACCGSIESVQLLLRYTHKQVDADVLEAASHLNHVRIIDLLIDAGAVDADASALCAAVDGRAEACVKLLLRRRGGHPASVGAAAYIRLFSDAEDYPLLYAFGVGRFHAPRMMRLFLDHGVDTSSYIGFGKNEVTDGTPRCWRPPQRLCGIRKTTTTST